LSSIYITSSGFSIAILSHHLCQAVEQTIVCRISFQKHMYRGGVLHQKLSNYAFLINYGGSQGMNMDILWEKTKASEKISSFCYFYDS
jgi:hypothetical protein